MDCQVLAVLGYRISNLDGATQRTAMGPLASRSLNTIGASFRPEARSVTIAQSFSGLLQVRLSTTAVTWPSGETTSLGGKSVQLGRASHKYSEKAATMPAIVVPAPIRILRVAGI